MPGPTFWHCNKALSSVKFTLQNCAISLESKLQNHHMFQISLGLCVGLHLLLSLVICNPGSHGVYTPGWRSFQAQTQKHFRCLMHPLQAWLALHQNTTKGNHLYFWVMKVPVLMNVTQLHWELIVCGFEMKHISEECCAMHGVGGAGVILQASPALSLSPASHCSTHNQHI